MAYGVAMRRFGKALKKFRDRVSHEVPTGPHTDVRKREINPSYKKRITGVGPPPKSINPGPRVFGAVKRKPKKSRNF